MGDLSGQELEEPVELVCVASQGGRQRSGIGIGSRLERPHLELQLVAELLDPAEHAYRVAFGEAGVEQVDVVPDARLDPPARVDELECEVRGTVARAQALLSSRPRKCPRRPVPPPAGRSRSRRESRS
jgi:hypothetical protein